MYTGTTRHRVKQIGTNKWRMADGQTKFDVPDNIDMSGIPYSPEHRLGIKVLGDLKMFHWQEPETGRWYTFKPNNIVDMFPLHFDKMCEQHEDMEFDIVHGEENGDIEYDHIGEIEVDG